MCVWTITPTFTVHIPLDEASYWFVFPLIVKLYLYKHSNLMGMYELKQGQYKIIYIRGSQQLVARNSSKKNNGKCI